MEYAGGCLCEAVRYRIVGPPLRGTVCHCGTCQKSSGSAFQVWTLFGKDQLTWTKGEPSSVQATPAAIRKFCGQCGSPLSFQFHDEDSDHIIGVTVGSLDNPDDFPPTRHNWVSEELAWLDRLSEIPRNENDAGDETKA